jgi:DNA (cytosine-5)-methyltransferase 3A
MPKRKWTKKKAKGIVVLSLFDGIACGMEALKRAGISVSKYYASEIDEQAIKVARANHPDIIHLGRVEDWRRWNIDKPDLILGGSPCQGFSYQGKCLNFDDPRSKLFFQFVDIVEHYKPRHWLLENVVMKQEWQDVISSHLKTEPIEICSSLVSAQTRPRKYWFNWDAPMPVDKGIVVSSVLAKNLDWFPAAIRGRKINRATMKRDDKNPDVPYSQMLTVKTRGDKMGCLTTVAKDTVLSRFSEGLYFANDYEQDVDWRYLERVEMERLQTLPDGYTSSVSENASRRLCGNGWTVDVIKHLLEAMVK